MRKEELGKRLYDIHYKLLLINESMKIFHDCDNITYELAQSLIEILQGDIQDVADKLENIMTEVC